MNIRLHVVTALAMVVALGGCASWCLKSISLKPQVSAVDVKTLSMGNIAVDNTIMFQDCCPSKEQQALALALQQSVADLYARLMNGDTSLGSTLEERRLSYNALSADAAGSIYNVILVCKGKASALPKAPHSPADAWRDVQNVIDRIKAKVGG